MTRRVENKCEICAVTNSVALDFNVKFCYDKDGRLLCSSCLFEQELGKELEEDILINKKKGDT